MYVSTSEGKIEHIAASPFEVEQELQKFFKDIRLLLSTTMTIEEVFFMLP